MKIDKMEMIEDFNERQERMIDVMEHVTSIDGYEIEEVMFGMLDSFSSELADIIPESEREFAFDLGEEVMELIKERLKAREGLSLPVFGAIGALASSVVFSTYLSAFDRISKDADDSLGGCDGDCRNCESCDGVNFKKLVDHYEANKIGDDYLAGLLKDGLLSLGDIQEHFDNEVASNVLGIASDSLKKDTSKKKAVARPSKKATNSDERVKRELAEFNELKGKIKRGDITLAEFKKKMSTYSNETVDVLSKEADAVLEKMVKKTGMSPAAVKAMIKNSMGSMIK